MSDVGSLSRAAGWQTKSIAELANHSLGKMLDKAKNRGEPQPYLRNLNVRWFDFDLSDVQEMRFQAGEEDRYSVHKGDLVICEGGYPGRAAIWNSDQPIYFQKALHRVRFHEPAHAKWCLYYLLSEDLSDRLRSNFNGTGIQHFTGEALARFRVPLPPLEETRRIVAILDEAFEGIATAKANAEKNLLNARELFDEMSEACFNRHVDGDFVPRELDELCHFIVDCEHKTAPMQDEGYPSIRTPNIGKGVLVLDGVYRVSEDTYKAWTRRAVPRAGDLILAREAPAGNVAVIPDGLHVCLGQRTVLIRPRREIIESQYLAHLLLQRSSQRRLLEHSRGATVQHVNMKDIRAFKISSVPSLAMQQQAIEQLSEIERTCEALQEIQRRKLTALDELKKSLLHQAFSGQLTSSKPARVAQPATQQTTSPEFTANVIALAYARHARQMREKSFGRVKEQKTLHLVEAIAKIDLGRQPMRDAAGPNDFQHMLKAEAWAKANGFFEMVSHDGRYEFKKLSAFEDRMAAARLALAPYLAQLDSVIDLLVAMGKTDAEVFATVHAAWNNLLIEGAAVTDDAIVSAAREGWHADKLEIPEHRFRSAIELIRQKGLVPDGTAKYVGGQQSLL
jgi:restriction endonuclease S subunit